MSSGRFSTTIEFADGTHTIQVQAQEATAAVNIAVDTQPPEVTIASPERASFIHVEDGDMVTVSGRVTDATSGIKSVKVNGQPVELTGSEFTTQIQAKTGMNHVMVSATDGAGFEQERQHSYIFGRFADWGTRSQNGLSVRLRCDAIRNLGEELEASLPALLAGFGSEGDLILENMQVGPMQLTLVCDEGFIRLDVSIPELSTDFRLEGILPTSGQLVSRRIDILSEVHLVAEAGELKIEIQNTNVAFETFELSVDGLPAFVVDLLQGLFRGIVGAGIAGALQDGTLTDAFDLTQFLPEVFELFGQPVRIDLAFSETSIDPLGISLSIDTGLSMVPDVAARLSPGLLMASAVPPFIDQPPLNLQANISDALVNQLLFNIWRSGLIDLSINLTELTGGELVQGTGVNFTLDAAG
ncbi:MAG: hypothetical protein AAFV29_21600, partial [Myxococcota bacterium]